MGKQRSHTVFGPDDYDQPTEPVERIVLPSHVAPTYNGDGLYPGIRPVPAPHVDTRPLPQGNLPSYPFHQTPSGSVYPALPPDPAQKYRGSAPNYRPAQIRRPRRSPVPGLVGLAFVLVQLLLLGRVACMIFNVATTTLWLNLLFLTSDLLVEPLRLLATHINLAFLAGTQLLQYLEFLVAILAYGLFARLFVGLLKALFRQR